LADEALHQQVQLLSQQMLHAVTLSFIHPVSGEKITCHAPYRPEFAELLETLRGWEGN